MRTGNDGIARLRGLPKEGRIEFRRDGEMHQVDFEPSPKQRGLEHGIMLTLGDPLLSIVLDEAGPDLVRATLRIDVERPTRRLFGTVPAEFRARGTYDEAAVQLFWAKLVAGESPQRRDAPIVPAADGSWSFDVTPDTTYLLWGERERFRCSSVARIEVRGEDVGPVALEPRRGVEVVVRVHRCPADGWIDLSVDDPGAVTKLGSVFESHGGTFERRLVLEGATTIGVGWRRTRGAEGGDEQRRVVDPATTPQVEFDLAGEGARDVVVEVDHGALPSPALLAFVGVDGDGVHGDGTARAEKRATMTLIDGRSTEPMALAPGRWLWFVLGDARGVIAGVADVPPPTVGVPITLRARLDERAAVEIGRGFTVESIAGVEIPAELRKVLQWVALGKPVSDAAILVPTGARIALREE
ncbi:MAG: hypothetical protein EXS13_12845 [Planctomycetes bacterium]|nr:hypothetical protein [Planctomycetota bacterium]